MKSNIYIINLKIVKDLKMDIIKKILNRKQLSKYNENNSLDYLGEIIKNKFQDIINNKEKFIKFYNNKYYYYNININIQYIFIKESESKFRLLNIDKFEKIIITNHVFDRFRKRYFSKFNKDISDIELKSIILKEFNNFRSHLYKEEILKEKNEIKYKYKNKKGDYFIFTEDNIGIITLITYFTITENIKNEEKLIKDIKYYKKICNK